MKFWKSLFKEMTNTISTTESMTRPWSPCAQLFSNSPFILKTLIYVSTKLQMKVHRLCPISSQEAQDSWVWTFKEIISRARALSISLKPWKNVVIFNIWTWTKTKLRLMVQWWLQNYFSLMTNSFHWILVTTKLITMVLLVFLVFLTQVTTPLKSLILKTPSIRLSVSQLLFTLVKCSKIMSVSRKFQWESTNSVMTVSIFYVNIY